MIKFTILLRRHEDLSLEQFIDYHRNHHAELFMSVDVVQRLVRGYVQQHAVDVEVPGLPPRTFDGITELWFDDVASIAELFSDESYLSVIRPDEAKMLDLPRCEFLVSEETVVVPPASHADAR